MDERRGLTVAEMTRAALRRGAPRRAPGNVEALQVSVASESRLVAESVAAALVDAGVHARSVLWWDEGSFAEEVAGSRDHVAVLISDLALPRVDDVCAHGRAAGARWLVITEAPRGPAWGAALDGGARAVVEATVSIDALISILVDIRANLSPIGEVERRSLLRQWWDAREQLELLRERMSTLTPRENEVLGLLYQGKTVRLIAARLEVSESTVRSQVKSVLRKLAVPSQLAAVATLDELQATAPHPRQG